MSKTIDQKVVEMRFDNKHFENNVQDSLSTLEKLKQKLNLSGAAKGLDQVNAAAKNVDMSGLSKGIETVHARFSALEVMGVTALANITNSAVNAGKRMISALTIDPIKTGFNEYETKINAIQTIMSNTASKGTTMEDVTRVIGELNTYADKTIYNFAEMTRNIGTFTAAGVGLEESAAAIQGIANLAAASGSNSQQASTAMYQLSQALAAGTVKLMDWNSVVNAGMGGEKFQEALKATAREHGLAIDQLIEDEGSFRDSLQKGWISADILNTTLKKFTVEGATEYANAMLKSGEYTEEQAKALIKEAQAMEDAATKVKTFTQLWDTMKESVQSGWSQTWEILVGNFEEAKELLSGVAAFFGDIINASAEARNTFLEGVMNITEPWRRISEKLDKAGLNKFKEVAETVADATDKLTKFQDVVTQVWRGDFKNADTGRYELLEKAGYDHRVVQDLVNKGYDYKLTVEDIEASHKKFGLTMDENKAKTTEMNAAIASLSDEQLRNAGLTDAEIKLYRDLEKEAKRTGVSISELVDEMSKTDGRTLMIETFQNAGSGLLGIFNALKEAWSEIFPGPSVVRVYNIIKAINEFSECLRLTEKGTGELNENGKKLQRTFKGIFAAVDIVLTILAGPLKIAFKILTQLLGVFDMNILDVTAVIGDAIVKFRDFLDSVLDFTGVFEAMKPYIVDFAAAVKDKLGKAFDYLGGLFKNVARYFFSFLDVIKHSDNIPQDLARLFDTMIEHIRSVVSNGLKNLPEDMISGFVNGVKDKTVLVVQTMLELGKVILSTIKEVLGIHSPSVEFFEIGQNVIAGFVNGIGAAIQWVVDAIKWIGTTVINTAKGIDFGSGLDKGKTVFESLFDGIRGIVGKIGEFLSNIDFGNVIAAGMSGGMLFVLVKIGKAIEALTSPFEGLGDIFDNFAGVLDAAKGTLKSFSWEIKSKALRNIAISLAILVGSLALLTYLDADKLNKAVEVLATLAVVLGLLAAAMNKFGGSGKSTDTVKDQMKGFLDIAKLSGLILSFGTAILLLAASAKIIATMTWPDLGKVGAFIGGFAVVIGALVAVASKFPAKELDKANGLIKQFSRSILLLAIAGKIIATMTWDDLGKVGAFVGGFSALVGALMVITNKFPPKKISGITMFISKVAVAFLLLGITAKLIAGMTWDDMGKAAAGLAGLGAIIAALIFVINKTASDKDLKSLGSTLLAISGAMLILTVVGKIIAGMDWGDMGKAGAGITGLAAIIAGLIFTISKCGNPGELKRVGSTLLMASISIGILAAVAMVMSLISLEGLAKGVIAVSMLGGIMALLMYSTKGAQDCKGNLLWMTIAIATLTTSVAVLSMLDPTRLAGATAAVTLLVGVFALLVKVAGTAKGSVATLAIMTVAVGMMAYIIYELAKLPVESTIGSAMALSLLVTALSISIALLSTFAGSAARALTGVLALTAMAVPLFLFTKILGSMENLQHAMDNVKVLTLLMGALTLMLIPLTIIGAFIPAAAAGIIALTAMAIPMAAFIGMLAWMENIENAEANAKFITSLMESMTALLLKISLVAPLALVGAVAIAALTGVIVAIGVLVTGIGALMEKFPALESFVDTGITLLNKLAYGIGSFIGNIVSGFVDSARALPELGSILSEFMSNVKPFIEGVKMVDESVLTGVGILAGAILALTAVDLVEGVASFLSGGSSFATLGTELSNFITNAQPFIEGASAIDPTIMSGIKTLAEAMLILTGANLLESLTSWFSGGVSLADFGAELAAFGPSLKAYSDAVTGIDNSAVIASSVAAKNLAEMASMLPNEGGLLGFLSGENDMEAFGNKLKSFGASLKAYSLAVVGLNAEAINISVTAGKSLAEMADYIPNMGGVLGFFTGDNDIATFGIKLQSFGASLKAYSATVVGLNIDAIDISVKATKSLAEMASSIPNLGGVVGWFSGDNDLATFGIQLGSFGHSLKAYSLAVVGISVEAIRNSVSAARSLAALSEQVSSDGGFFDFLSDDITDFGAKLIPFGRYLKGYSDVVVGVNTASITGSVTAVNMLSRMINNLADLNTKGVASFTTAINTLSKVSLDRFISTFGSATPRLRSLGSDLFESIIEGMKSKQSSVNAALIATVVSMNKTIVEKQKTFNSSGTLIMQQFVTGVKKTVPQARQSVTTTLAAMVTTIRSYYSRFKTAGKYLVQGFANGIALYSYIAELKAAAMARAAARAAEEELEVNSPSKVFQGIGEFAGMGFVNGLGAFVNRSYAAGTEIAASAKNGLSEAIARVRNAIDSDMEMQPTIRPVLDLSEVRAGSSAIGSMFNLAPSVGLRTNVGTIGRMMNQRQNGGNDDIVSAIDKLGNIMSNMDRASYNINGVTYDDGSNIVDAVKTIVRAAKIERRV